jgi:hypothetical protein
LNIHHHRHRGVNLGELLDDDNARSEAQASTCAKSQLNGSGKL